MKIAAYMMSVPERAARAMPTLAAMAPMSVSLSVDYNHDGPWANARRCWTAQVDSDYTHRFVMHDDAIVCRNFPTVLHNIVSAWPDRVLSLYCRRPEHRNVPPGGALECTGFAWGLALCAPVEIASDFVAWCDKNCRAEWIADDTRWSVYLAATGQSLLCPNPCVVDHDSAMCSTMHGKPNVTTPAYNGRPDGVLWGGRVDQLHTNRYNFVLTRQKHLTCPARELVQ